MSNKTQLQEYAVQMANKYGIPPSIFKSMINQESGFNPNARSKAGAMGIAQIMPGTAKGWGVNPMDPYKSLDAAAKNIARYNKTYKGDWPKTLSAYNAGPGAVAKYGGVPPYKETINYYRTIMKNAGIPINGNLQNASNTGMRPKLDMTRPINTSPLDNLMAVAKPPIVVPDMPVSHTPLASISDPLIDNPVALNSENPVAKINAEKTESWKDYLAPGIGLAGGATIGSVIGGDTGAIIGAGLGIGGGLLAKYLMARDKEHKDPIGIIDNTELNPKIDDSMLSIEKTPIQEKIADEIEATQILNNLNQNEPINNDYLQPLMVKNAQGNIPISVEDKEYNKKRNYKWSDYLI